MKFKTSLLLICTVVFSTMVFQSCNKINTQETGTIEFGMDPLTDEALKSVETGHHRVSAALVTIVDMDGVQVYDKEYLDFYTFGDAYVTRSLKLNVGSYQLTEFMLVDSSGTVIWATPVEGARIAGMVTNPVPISFTVYADNSTRVSPEVVRVKNHPPADFGYVNFDVEFVDNFCIKVFFESSCDEWYNDSIYLLNDSSEFAPYTRSRLAIFTEGEMLSETYLTPGRNKVRLPQGHDIYRLVVFDCGNQVCYSEVFELKALRYYNCAEGEFLHINCGRVSPDVIITPDDIHEPTIEQGVFGRLTEPAMDSSATDEYQVQPLVTEIYIFEHHQGDTIYYPAMGTSCYVIPDMNVEPLAIVRSNIHGYYQLPLEAGEYVYMIKTPYGYYIDMYVSSHRPGRFGVQAGEVTKLNIHIQPCIWY